MAPTWVVPGLLPIELFLNIYVINPTNVKANVWFTNFAIKQQIPFLSPGPYQVQPLFVDSSRCLSVFLLLKFSCLYTWKIPTKFWLALQQYRSYILVILSNFRCTLVIFARFPINLGKVANFPNFPQHPARSYRTYKSPL